MRQRRGTDVLRRGTVERGRWRGGARVPAFLVALVALLLAPPPTSAQALALSAFTTQASTNSARVAPGTAVTDSATLTAPAGGPVPTGTVTYTLVGPNPDATCTTPIAGSTGAIAVGSPSGPFTVTTAGAYNFVATYSGDANYAAIAAPVGCGVAAERFTVSPGPVALTTQASTNSATVSPGTVVTDTATLTPPAGGPVPTGTVSYTLVGPNPNATCTAPVQGTTSTSPVGASSGSFTVADPGAYNFVATYSGDAIYEPITTPVGCGAAAERFSVVSAASTTTSTTTAATTTTAPGSSTTTTTAPAATTTASATDPTGDNGAGLDPRGDLVRAGADYGTSVVLSATAATPSDPRTDPNWLRAGDPITGIVWFIDTNNDGVEDYFTGLVSGTPPLSSRVIKGVAGSTTSTACAATGSFSSGQLKTTFDPSCIGKPKSFRIKASMTYATTTASSIDFVPDSGYCCLVTQAATSSAVSAPTASGSTSGSQTSPGSSGATGSTLPRTGSDPLPLTLVSIVLLVAGRTLTRRGRRRRELADFKALVFGGS